MARLQRATGGAVIAAAPWLMKGLSIVGTAAMFLVGGGILTHGLPGAHGLIHAMTHAAASLPGIGGMLDATLPLIADAVVGILTGALVLGSVTMVQRMWR